MKTLHDPLFFPMKKKSSFGSSKLLPFCMTQSLSPQALHAYMRICLYKPSCCVSTPNQECFKTALAVSIHALRGTAGMCETCPALQAALHQRRGKQERGAGFGRQGTWCASAEPPPALPSALDPDQARASAIHCPALQHTGQHCEGRIKGGLALLPLLQGKILGGIRQQAGLAT